MSFGLRARAATALLELAFNPGQRRGSDGRWVKLGGQGSAVHKPRLDPALVPTAEKYADSPRARLGVDNPFYDEAGTERLYDHLDNDFPSHLRKPSFDEMDTKEIDTLPIETYRIADLIQTQEWITPIDPDHESWDRNLPVVYRMPDGSTFLLNGHHRVAQAALRGDEMIEAREYSIENGIPLPSHWDFAVARGAMFGFNPHQRRGPDGRWIKMPTSELKRPRRPRKSRAAKAASAPALAGTRSDELPPVNLPDPMAGYRRKRDEYNDAVLSVARYVTDRNDLAGKRDAPLAERLADAERPGGTHSDQDDAVDDLRTLLDASYMDVAIGLDRPPQKPETRPAPVLPPGPRTRGGSRPPLTDRYEDRRQALDASIRSGIDGQDFIGGGAMGDTRRVRLADGTEAIYKRALASWGSGWGKKEQTDAEELGAMVAAAVGVRAPAIQRADDDNLYMEIMPGGSAISRRFYVVPNELADSPQGMRMGLLDTLLNNSDRHGGNWMIDDRGQIAAIDHGLAFRDSKTNRSTATRSRFSTDHFIYDDGAYRDRNPLTRFDVEAVRQQLEAIRPRFEQLGRRAWYKQVLERLDELSARAAGFRSLIEETPEMFSSRAAAATAILRGPAL
jgi:hypothetical protein